jgi:site-specific DNA-methyltransferase (adenine-specific)
MLRLCDVRDGLLELRDGSVNLIVCDPPYKNISGGKGKPGDGSPQGNIGPNDGNAGLLYNNIEPYEYAHDLYRVLADRSHCYMMSNFMSVDLIRSDFERVGFKTHRYLIWRKGNKTPSQYYMNDFEYIIFMRKGRARPVNDPSIASIIDIPGDSPSDKQHPNQKPIALMRLLIEQSSEPGDLILDPFMGGGSTGIAAHATGRNFIGFEIDPKHYITACNRIGVMP